MGSIRQRNVRDHVQGLAGKRTLQILKLLNGRYFRHVVDEGLEKVAETLSRQLIPRELRQSNLGKLHLFDEGHG